ncbi:MAG TPA: carboxylating nicotinate-nucleotide diphosphorylase [Steroidobacteraceae bacterium]|nr:carboxylating nicotinate-nucleotide diphosphorylase [Steroidobacteraceae bacterium]
MHDGPDARTAVLSERAPALPQDLRAQVERALAEDVGSGDLTADLVPPATRAVAQVITREPAVLCGGPWFEEVFRQLDNGIRVDWLAAEGANLRTDDLLCRVSGAARPILTGERTALNFLQTLSATATAARRFVDAVAGTGCRILDTRKTLPGLRAAQKYAVACAGAENHRLGLYDAILVKENHIVAAGSIAAAVNAARQGGRTVKVEVEVETLKELEEAVVAGADMALLDEFTNADLVKAVELNRARGRPLLLEASGGVSLDNARDIALTGVDYISVGGITKHIQAVDLSMRFSLLPKS